MRAFCETHPHFGVDPVCRALDARPGSYYDCKNHKPSKRELRDEELKPEIKRVRKDNRKVYGARKVYKQLKREGINVAWCTVRRLMKDLGIEGIRRGKKHKTTKSDPKAPRPADLVKRDFKATRPNQLFVCDFTYVATWAGTVYVAFVVDVFSRKFVGWRAATSMTKELVLDALEMAIWSRGDVTGVIAHSDAGSQYTSIRYTERLGEIGAAPSIGTVGDALDNALMESAIGLYKTELINKDGPWRNHEHVEIETCDYLYWFNNKRLHSEIGDTPPTEFEETYYRLQQVITQVA